MQVIECFDGDQVAFWDGVWWVDDPLEAATYRDDQVDDALIDAEASGKPDDMAGGTIRPVDAAHSLDSKREP